MDLKEAKRYMRKHATLIRTIQQRPFTFVEVCVGITAPITGVGFSKVMHPDRWDADRGLAIARGKAEVDAARQLLARRRERC